jgi:hypothetical protein
MVTRDVERTSFESYDKLVESLPKKDLIHQCKFLYEGNLALLKMQKKLHKLNIILAVTVFLSVGSLFWVLKSINPLY